jgi:hypothetical protein
LSPDDIAQLVKQIQTHKARFIGRHSLTITYWVVTHVTPYRRVKLLVVYDKVRKTLRTALPYNQRLLEKLKLKTDRRRREAAAHANNIGNNQQAEPTQGSGTSNPPDRSEVLP